MYQNFNLLEVDWGLVINVTITGIAIVFGMLVLLVLVLSVFGLIFSKANRTKKVKEPKAEKPALKAAPVKTEPAATVTAANNDEIIAVIAAAVAAMYEGSDVKPIIRKIKKSATNTRPAWTAAGIFENTRAF